MCPRPVGMHSIFMLAMLHKNYICLFIKTKMLCLLYFENGACFYLNVLFDDDFLQEF